VKQKQLRINSFRKFGKNKILSFDQKMPGIAPGQFLLAYHNQKNSRIFPTYYVSHKGGTYYSYPDDSNWEIGDLLTVRGPIGNGFDNHSIYQNLLLMSLDIVKGSLNPLLENGIKLNKNVSYYLQDRDIDLPHSVEIILPDMLEESITWADFIAIEIVRENLDKYQNFLQKMKNSGVNCELMIYTPILCSGISECMVCALKTNKGWVRSCQDGQVIKLNNLEFE
jgi:NAD(P)H-flavin reductase